MPKDPVRDLNLAIKKLLLDHEYEHGALYARQLVEVLFGMARVTGINIDYDIETELGETKQHIIKLSDAE